MEMDQTRGAAIEEHSTASSSDNIVENKNELNIIGDANSTNNRNDIDNDDNYHIRIPIVGYETMEERARFTVFKLRVEHVKLEENWLVFRRYTDFVRLHSKLKEEFPNVNIPFPPKRWLRDNFETAFLEDRMKGLQAFVDSILVQPILTDSPLVREFFCMDEPPLYSENAEESRSLFGTLEEHMIVLKHKLSERDAEIEILRAELAFVSTQRDNILKAARNCRSCSQRQSLPMPSPSYSEFPSPMASSSPSTKSQRSFSGSNTNGNQVNAPLTPVNGVKTSHQINGISPKLQKSNGIFSRSETNKRANVSPSASPSKSLDSTPSPKVRTKLFPNEINNQSQKAVDLQVESSVATNFL